MSLRIEHREDLPVLTIVDGMSIKPLMGASLSIQEVRLEPGTVVAVHAHDEEQAGYIASGSCHFTDGEHHWELGPGDCYHAPPGVPHGATALSEGCVIVDAFSPPREQVLKMLAERGA